MDGKKVGTVLIVDDDSVPLEVMRDMMEELGYEIKVARDGREMLEQVRRTPLQLILLDIFMPGMDGYTALTRLRGMSEMAGVPVLIVSANPSPFHSQIVQSFNKVDFLAKPFSLTKLREKLTQMGISYATT